MNIRVTESTERKPRPGDSELRFGRYKSDHMFLMDYARGAWRDARVEPYRDLKLDPAAKVLHYNQEVFEGLKAFRQEDGGIALFRPDLNIQRLNRSARRMVMPVVDPDLFLSAVETLIQLDRDWVPEADGTSLYIRPTMIATEPTLGVSVSSRYLFFVITLPVGAFYAEGANPTRIYVEQQHVRAVRGGVGAAKTSGNYSATLLATREAERKGYTQVLWLDAKERKYVEEVGTSNIFFYVDDGLVTPPLDGTILPGVTRDSVIQIARDWGLKLTERPITIDEVVEGCSSRRVKEVFATGTATVISPVGWLAYNGAEVRVADGETGELSTKLYEEITGIQYGRKEDRFDWRVRVA